MEMNQYEREEAFQNAQLIGATEQANLTAMQNIHAQQEIDKTIAEAQLEVETTLINIYYRLRQDFQMPDNKGRMQWHPIKDPKKRRLTDEGVERIMELMSFFINKENLLSNFTEDQIKQIMLTYRLAFSANIFMRYQIYFREPTVNECKEIILESIEKQIETKKFTLEIRGLELDVKTIRKQIIDELDIEKEIEKIRKEKLKENLSEFELLFEELSQMVLATLNRAWKGEERGSLRRHTSISEVIGSGRPMMMKPKESRGLFKWGRKEY